MLAFTSSITAFPYAAKSAWGPIFGVVYLSVIVWLMPKIYAETGPKGVLAALFIWLMGGLYALSPEHDCLYLLSAVVAAGTMAAGFTEEKCDKTE